MQVWRICRAVHAATAFSGDGAWTYGGRWNPRNVFMAYAAPSRALAAMEFWVNMDPSTPAPDLRMCSAELPDSKGILQRIKVANLPNDWRGLNNEALKKLGAEWIESGRSLALEVPSVVVEGEWNVLLNPAHPDFAKVKIGKPEPFQYDLRMFGK